VGAVAVGMVHVSHREHGYCANDVVAGPLPVRELPLPRGDEQVQHLHNQKPAPQGHPVQPGAAVAPHAAGGGEAPHAPATTLARARRHQALPAMQAHVCRRSTHHCVAQE